jgi:hypothetical protein
VPPQNWSRLAASKEGGSQTGRTASKSRGSKQEHASKREIAPRRERQVGVSFIVASVGEGEGLEVVVHRAAG